MANSANRQFTNAETAAFCSELSTIMKSGISLIEGLTLMMESSDSADEKAALGSILDEFMNTGDISSALKETSLFPDYMVSMMAIGSETGRLDDVLEHLSNHYEREAALAKSIKDAITYPLIMTGMIVVVIGVLMIKVMPVFNQVFMQLGSELTGLPAALMNAGTVISRSSVGIVIVICVLAALGLLAIFTEKGKEQAKKIGYSIGPFARILERTAACRFAGGMAISLGSGLTLDRSFELVSQLNDDDHFKQKLHACSEMIFSGTDFATALKESGIFTGQYARMAAIGEKTGSQDKTMEKIAQLCQDEVDDRITGFIGALEPTLVVILSVVVGIVLLSVMLPLMGIMSTL